MNGRPTRATLKAFVRRNAGKLFIWQKSAFDGMIDGCRSCEGGWVEAGMPDLTKEYDLGIPGMWLVRGGGDLIQHYDNAGYTGFSVYNCCGSCIIAVRNVEKV